MNIWKRPAMGGTDTIRIELTPDQALILEMIASRVYGENTDFFIELRSRLNAIGIRSNYETQLDTIDGSIYFKLPVIAPVELPDGAF